MTEELDSVIVEKAYEELDDNILDIANDTLDYSVSQLKGLGAVTEKNLWLLELQLFMIYV